MNIITILVKIKNRKNMVYKRFTKCCRGDGLMKANINDPHYIINNFSYGNMITFDYKDYMGVIISAEIGYAVKGKNFQIYMEIEQIDNEMETFHFYSIEEAFEKIVIYKQKLKEIWKDVTIVYIKLGKE